MPYELEEQVGDLTTENEKLETLIAKHLHTIQLLADALGSALALQNRLLNEVLALHAHADERLPMELIKAKDEFDQTIRKLLEEYHEETKKQ